MRRLIHGRPFQPLVQEREHILLVDPDPFITRIMRVRARNRVIQHATRDTTHDMTRDAKCEHLDLNHVVVVFGLIRTNLNPRSVSNSPVASNIHVHAHVTRTTESP